MIDHSHIRHGLESFLESQSVHDDKLTGNAQALEIRVQSNMGHINLRGKPQDPAFVTAVEEVLGQALPLSPNTMSMGELRIYWLGPDEWQILCPLKRATSLIDKLRSVTVDRHVGINDISAGQVVMNLSGPSVRDTLAAGCTLDFHPQVFEIGSCAQSGLSKTSVLIGRLDGSSQFEIVVRRSFAEYLALWFQHSANHQGVLFLTS